MGLKATNKDKAKKDTKKDFGAMNEPEVKSAKKADEEAVNLATAERLNLLLGMVPKKVTLDETFSVCKFGDKGKVMDIALENEDFVVSIQVKDSERHGLVVEQ